MHAVMHMFVILYNETMPFYYAYYYANGSASYYEIMHMIMRMLLHSIMNGIAILLRFLLLVR